MKLVDVGLFDHTIAAFWYFVIVSEMLLALKRSVDGKARYDSKSLAISNEIGDTIEKFRVSESGDFTFRLNRLGNSILQELKRLEQNGEKLSPEKLTNIVFEGPVTQIRTLIEKSIPATTKMVFLFDNIDKGWPANGVPPLDVRMVRLLIETLDKVKRDFDVRDREFMSAVFLRNDIYEVLVDETPDRGKGAETRIDWTDRAKLRQVIYRRLQASVKDGDQRFAELWNRFFVDQVRGRESFEYFVDHCLMRPRFLINVIDNAIANGINRGHERVQEDDCIDAVRQHSLYLVNDFGYEIRDVSGLDAALLYAFVGITKYLTKAEIFDAFRRAKVDEDRLENALWLMLWYGVIGITSAGSEKYIYDYDYNMKRLEAEIRSTNEEMLYAINTALHVGLSS
jgi:hypothetical protein